MSIGPLGPLNAAAAGTPLAQNRGEVDQSKQTGDAQTRRVALDRQASTAAGIGEADGENHEASERDADGRRVWEITEKRKQEEEQTEDPCVGQDPHGDLGRIIDLSG